MQTKPHNATLDGLRGIAAIAVMLGHFNGAYLPPGVHPRILGNMAVDFFFILSGFVIAQAYDDRLKRDMGPWRFTKIRLIRLWPMILFGTLLSVALAGVHQKVFYGAIVGLLLIPFAGAPLDGPLWSLTYEVWGNVLYGWVAKYQAAIIGLTASGAALLLAIALRGHPIETGYALRMAPVGVGQFCWCFFLGVLLGNFLTHERVQKLPSVHFSVLAAVLFALLVAFRNSPGYDLLCVFVLLPSIVVLGAKDVAVGYSRRLALLAGAISYPLYAIHYPLVHEFARVAGKQPPLVEGLFLAVVVAFSWAVLKWYDEPVRAWLGRAARRPVKSNAVVVSGAD
jgi:peptidoglycan/LPS O-acetylase OafA/YrhL